MNSTAVNLIKRVARYIVFGIIIKAIMWVVKKIGGSVVSIIAILATAIFIYFLFFAYREVVIEKLNDAAQIWEDIRNGVYSISNSRG